MASFASSSKQLRGVACSLCHSSMSSTFAASTSRTAPAISFFSTSAKVPVSQPSEESKRAAGRAFRNATDSQGIGMRLSNIVSSVAAEGGVRRDSIVGMRRTQEAIKAASRTQKKLYNGQSLRPGDLSYKRMYPDLPTRAKQSSLGPSHDVALKTDFLLNNGDINPLNECMNAKLLSRFVTNVGKIMNRGQTQLTWKNQRRVGKAIRRARAMGVMPYFADWSDDGAVYQAKYKKFGMWETRP